MKRTESTTACASVANSIIHPLRVAGSRRDENCTETVSYHQLEITYSRFERTIRFPCPIEGASIQTRYKDGLLLLHLLSPEECD